MFLSGASTSIPDKKKYAANLYNPPSHGAR